MAKTQYNWGHNYIRNVREEKDRFREDRDKQELLKLVAESAYSTDIHCILELIQNAEDEESSIISFTATKNHLLIKNNGRPFSKDDVYAICSAGQSKKENKIGFFGIGFKSVFNISSRPQIISGKFNFVIKDYIYPAPADSLSSLIKDFSQQKGAYFVLLLDKGPSGKVLAQEFYEINDRLLLFLSNIRKIEFVDKTRKKEVRWEISKDEMPNRLVKIKNTGSKTESTWKVFKKIYKVSDDSKIRVRGKERVKKTALVVAFPVPSKENPVDISAECVYCFLPTKKRTDLSFLIQGDFIPTLGRENIEENGWNEWLFSQVADLAVESFLALREDEVFKDRLYDLIPLPEEVPDPMIKVSAEKIIQALKDKAISQDENGRWHKPSRIALMPNELRHLFTNVDLKGIFEETTRKSYKDLSGRAMVVLKKIGIKEVTIADVVHFLSNAKLIRRKTAPWFLDIYDYLASELDDYSEEAEELKDKLWDISFLRTSSGDLITPKNEDRPDQLITHYPQKKDLGNLGKIFKSGELVFLDKYFQIPKKHAGLRIDEELEEKRKKVKDFLADYGVRKYMEEYHIINDVILPIFDSGKYLQMEDKQLVIFTNFIRENLSLYENRIRSQRSHISDEKIFEDIKKRLKLKGFYYHKGRKKHGFFVPNELHFPKFRGKPTQIYKVFQGVDDVPFLSPIYYNRNLVKGYSAVPRTKARGRKREIPIKDTFFQKMGVWSSPRLLEQSIPVDSCDTRFTDFIYDNPSTPGYDLVDDHYLPGFENLLKHLASKTALTCYKRLELFRDLLAKNWPLYSKFSKSRLQWFYYTSKSKPVESTFLYQLRNSPWLPAESVKTGLFKPTDTDLATAENKHLVSSDNPLVVPRKGFGTFYQDLGVRDQPSKEYVLAYLRRLREQWQKKRFPKKWQPKLETIYKFLLSELSEDGEMNGEIKKAFSEQNLIFLPTEKKNWWKLKELFWNDISNIFSDFRGYLSEVYTEEMKLIFESVGLKERPDLEDCVRMLGEIRNRYQKNGVSGEEKLRLRGMIDPIYLEINTLIANDSAVPATNLFEKPLFLTTKGSFVRPSEALYCDDTRLGEFFKDCVNIIWLGSDWRKLLSFFEVVRIASISSKISTEVKTFGKKDAPPEEVNFFRSLADYIEPYIKYHQPAEFDLARENGELEVLRTIRVRLVSSLSVEFIYSKNKKRIGLVEPNAEAFWDPEKNILYAMDEPNWLTNSLDSVSSELSKVFKKSGLSLKTQLESLLSAGFDENELARKFSALGIPTHAAQFLEPQEQKLLEGSEEEVEEEETESGEGSVTEKMIPVETTTDTSFTSQIKPEELIKVADIAKFVLRKEKIPTVELQVRRKKKPLSHLSGKGAVETRVIRKSTVSRMETEAAAIDIVLLFEDQNGRRAKNVSRFQGLGYDIESTGRFIEVKSFKEDAGALILGATEYEKAHDEGDKYYIYVVSNILKGLGKEPRIQIIQNPVKYIAFVADKREANKWKDAVSEEAELVIDIDRQEDDGEEESG